MSPVRRVAALALVCSSIWSAAPGSAATPCWQRVIDDWRANGRIDRSYPIGCYREAAANLPEDLRQYSSAPEDIQRAMLLAVGHGPRNPPEAGSGSSGSVTLELLALIGGSIAIVALLSAIGRLWWGRLRKGGERAG